MNSISIEHAIYDSVYPQDIHFVASTAQLIIPLIASGSPSVIYQVKID